MVYMQLLISQQLILLGICRYVANLDTLAAYYKISLDINDNDNTQIAKSNNVPDEYAVSLKTNENAIYIHVFQDKSPQYKGLNTIPQSVSYHNHLNMVLIDPWACWPSPGLGEMN